MKCLRLAMVQLNPIVGDLEGNKEKILYYFRLAGEHGADLVTFPELSICGYPPEDLLLKPSFIEDNLKILKQIQEVVDSPIICLGFADRGDDGQVYNAAALLHQNAVKGVCHKIHLPNYGVFDERRYFQPGSYSHILKLGELNIGITICEDLWYSDVIRELSQQGAQLILNISASPYHKGKGRLRERLFKGLAKEHGVFLVYTNLVGGQDELVFDGHSLAFDRKGHLLARGRSFEEELLVLDLPLEALIQVPKPSENSRSAERIARYYPVQRFSLPFSPKERPCAEIPPKVSLLTPLAEIYGALLLGIRDYVRKNGFQKVAVGLSGGLDSALTVVLAVDALGRENVVGVIMPSQFSSVETQKDAKLLAENIKIHSLRLPIHDIYHDYLRILAEAFRGYKSDVTEENLQARIRGNLLMALSNKFGWLVLTTGNKSETSVGYCTIYGDTAGGFAAIKDIPKTYVYHLARYRNKQAGYDLIPNTVLERAPSAELAPNQRDQDSLPPYPLLDAILERYVEKDESFAQIVASGYDSELVKGVIRMVDRNEYKRRQSPPGIKISPRAFGRDRRMPITNRYWPNSK
ncbi:MAG: NAD+ synthase [bacterium]